MSRTEKKCFMASTGLHLLLLLLLIVGPALSFSGKAPNITPIDFIPSKIIEGAMAGGGNPNANPPPPAPPAPQPPLETPVQAPRIEQPTELPRPTQPRRNELNPEPTSKPTRHEIQVSTKLITRRSADRTTNSRPSSDSREAQARREAEAIGRAAAGIRNNLAPTTTIDLRGPGGGGETYAGVEQAILSVYDHAWISPEGMDTSEAVVEVSITIESDGTVSSARITHPSGDARVDESVQRALDRVSSIPGWDGKRRTVEFSFKSRAKAII